MIMIMIIVMIIIIVMNIKARDMSRVSVVVVEQLHSRGVFWRIRGGLPGAVGLGDSWKRGTDNPLI